MDDYEYDYFMVRVRRTPAGTGETGSSGETGAGEIGRTGETGETRQIALSGVAERLDTGEKHLFSNGAELLELMLGGHANPKLPPDSRNRNDGPDTVKPALRSVMVALLVGLSACGDDATSPIDPGAGPPAGFAIEIPGTIVRGQAFTLTVTALDDAGLPETTWSGSVALSASGGTLSPANAALVNGAVSVQVTLSGHVGEVTLRASSGAVQSDAVSAMVVSGAAPARIEIVPASALLTAAGATQTFAVRAFDAQGAPTAVPQVTWTSNDPATLAIDGSGLATAQAAVGSGMIVAEANGIESAPALVLIAQPATNTVLLADSQIVTAPVAVDPAAPYEPGWQYRVRVRGSAPAVGDIVIGTGESPLAGRVTATSDAGTGETDLTIELMPLNQLFTDLRIDERIPMIGLEGGSGAQPGPSGYSGVPPAYGSVGMADVDFGLGRFKCKASTTVPSLDLPSPTIDITPDLYLQIGYNNGLERLAVTGTVSADAAYKPVFKATFEGSTTCETVVKTFTIPANGPISLFYGVQVPLGIGFTLAGKLEIAEVGFHIRANATADVELGVTCAAGACSGLTTFDMTRDGSLQFIAPDPSEQFRVELGGHAFLFARPFMGSLFTDALSFEFVAATAGLRQTIDLATTHRQVEDTAYASSFNLQFLAKIGAGKDLQNAIVKLGKLLGTDLSASLTLLEVDDTLATSPRGSFTISPARVLPGDSTALGDLATFTVELDPVTYLGVHAVDRVEFFWKHENEDSTFTLGPGRPSCVDVDATSGQTTFECETDFLVNHIGEQTFHAFVHAKLFGVPLPFPLEVGAFAAADVTVSQQCTAPPAGLVPSLAIRADTAIAGDDVTEGLSYTAAPHEYGHVGMHAAAVTETAISTARLEASAEFDDYLLFLPVDPARMGEDVRVSVRISGSVATQTDIPQYEASYATAGLAGLVSRSPSVDDGDEMEFDELINGGLRLGEWEWLHGFARVNVEKYRIDVGESTASAVVHIGDITIADAAGAAVEVTICSASGRQY